MKKRFLCLFLSLLLLFSLASCATLNEGAASTKNEETITETAAEETSEKRDDDVSVKEALEKTEGIKSVEFITPAEGSNLFSERYLLIFDQPFDWNDPSKGTFPQRVAIYLSEDAEINVMETQGYFLQEYAYDEETRKAYNIIGMDIFAPEMVNLVTKSGNYINVEHRFFGESRPSDMNNTDTKYWEYNTPENAANDYHKIYSALAPVLGERWISVGTSRGGLMTNVYAKYYPEDMDVYIPYVAPCSDGIDGNSMYKFVYEQIGDDVFGKEKAAEYRQTVLDFQAELIKNKNILLGSYADIVEGQGIKFQNDLGDYGILYDLNVLEFAVQVWQKKDNQDFESLRNLLDMPEDTTELKAQKFEAIFQTFYNVQNPQDWAYSYVAWPYYVDGVMYYGQYLYDFSYIRKALEKEGAEDALSVTADMDKDIPWNIVFTPEQRETFKYDGAFRALLSEDMKTTKAKHLMIFGATDPWISQAIPEEITKGNDNIRRYINPNYPHESNISNMPQETKNEIIETLKDWLSIK